MSAGKTGGHRKELVRDPFQRDLSAWVNPERIRLPERVLSELSRMEKQLLGKIRAREI